MRSKSVSEGRYPQLAHWGAYTAVTRDGRLVACEPFFKDAAPSRMLESIIPMVYSPKRIQRPAVRRGWLASRGERGREQRGKDEFVEISWDEALDLVAREVTRTRAEKGAQGIFCGSYGWASAGRLHHARSLVRRFYFQGGGGVDQVGNYSWGTAQFLLPYVIGTYGPLTGQVTSWPNVIANAEVFVAFGGLAVKNGQISAGGAGEHTQIVWLRKLAQSGARVVNISPTRDDCPAFLDAEWIPIRPNTDVALMLALAFELRRLEAHDTAFLATYCVGYEALEAYFTGQSDGVPKNPKWAAEITGVPADKIRELALLLRGRRSFLTCSYAVQRAQHGEQPYWMVIALAAMLGQIGLPGGGFGFGHGSSNGLGNPRIATPGPDLPVVVNPAGLSIPVARITEMLERPREPYAFLGKTQHYPDIDFIHWAGGNPFHHHQQLNRLLAAWRRKPRTIVVNEIWWTPLAKMADIVLPITTALERNDIGGSSRDRFALAMHRAIDPVGQSRNDLDVFTDLAERLGYRDRYTQGRAEMDWVEYIYTQFAAPQRAAGVSLADFASFWSQGYVELPAPEEEYVFMADFRRDPVRHRLHTPSGRIELYSETIASYGLADCGPHPRWMPPREWLGGALAQTYPLHLLTVQPADRLHSQLDAAPLAQSNKVAGHEALRIHPEDAAERGIAEGDEVRLYNDRGACLVGAQLDKHILRGTVVMATGAWFAPDVQGTGPERAGAANVLTLDIGTSSLTQGPNAMSCLVQAERWSV